MTKSQVDRLDEIEEQMLLLVEVPDKIQFLESRLDKMSSKVDKIDEVSGRLDRFPIRQLMKKVEVLESKATRLGSFERGDSSTGSIAHMEERIEELDGSQKAILQMVTELSEDFRATLDVVRGEVADLNAKVNLTMRAVEKQAPTGGAVQFKRVKVPEPKPFCGVLGGKALENFIFDLEQYFRATNIVTEESKITLATMYLADDAKLWWRFGYMDIRDGRCTVDTWERLKQELRSQFFPKHVDILARRKMRKLKHTGNVRDYMKQFSELLLDIRNMSEMDKVFNFVDGLKPWLKSKLYEQRVQDLSTAYATAERLFDLINEPGDGDRRPFQ